MPRANKVFELGREHRLEPIAATDVVPASVPKDALVELAWNGHRVLAVAVGDDVRLVATDFREWADVFPTVRLALQRLKRRDIVLEGFLCALGEGGLPSFELLRRHVQRETQRIVFACVDLQRLDGEDLRKLPLAERRRRLAALIADDNAFAFSDSVGSANQLDAVLEGVRQIGARGVLVRTTTSWLALSCTAEPIALERSLSAPPKATNREKLMYPRDGFAKRDVIAYYDDVAELMIPYLADRPVIGQRWPDGIDDFTWYQHRMPPRAPDYLRAVWIEGNRRIVAENRDSLCWLANQAVLTFHGWASRCRSLAHPDWVVIDLDPGPQTTWANVIEVAQTLRKLLELLELPSVPKTSGQKGLHVLIPLAAGQSVQDAHEFARRIASMLCQVLPDRVTMEAQVADRKGRLYLDTLQNFVGKTLVLPYSLRAVDGAPVSTPLAWSEVTPDLDPRTFTLKTVRRRLDSVGDLASALLTGAVELKSALTRLAPS